MWPSLFISKSNPASIKIGILHYFCSRKCAWELERVVGSGIDPSVHVWPGCLCAGLTCSRKRGTLALLGDLSWYVSRKPCGCRTEPWSHKLCISKIVLCLQPLNKYPSAKDTDAVICYVRKDDVVWVACSWHCNGIFDNRLFTYSYHTLFGCNF